MWRLFAALIVTALTGQTTVPVTAVWDLDADHDTVTSWELEADSAIVPCVNLQVLPTERRCTADVPQSASLFRLRGVRDGAIGGWSAFVSQGEGPGPFSITFAGELPDEPDMALSFVDDAAAAGAVVNLPVFTVGDLAIVHSYRSGSTTAPSLPIGWNDLGSSSQASPANSERTGWRILQEGDTDTGTWTNATVIAVQLYQGYAVADPFGHTVATGGESSDIAYSALTLEVTDGSSWVVGFAGITAADTSLETPPTGMTNRSNATGSAREIAGHDTNAGVSSWAGDTVAVGGTSARWRSRTIELLAAAGGGGGSVAKAYQFLSFGVH